MFWTQFKLMFRNLQRNKLYSSINIFGLAIGITLVLLLSSYVSNEISVDSFHANKERLYRVQGDNIKTFAPPFGDLILESITEAERYTRTFSMDGTLSCNNQKFRIENCLLVDSAFFTMFSFPIEMGNPKELLATKECAVLAGSLAKKLFGSRNPIGETLKLDGKTFNISGVFQDFKDNTHFLKPEIIVSYCMLPRLWGMNEKGVNNFMKSYDNSSFGLYVMAKKNSNIKLSEDKLLEKVKAFYWVFQDGRNKELSFMPLEEVYFNLPPLDYIGTRQGNKKFLNVLIIIAFSIVIIAAINYINLSITQSVKRAKEVGVKKIVGAFRGGIISQFLMESTIISLIATIIAVLLTMLFLPEFNSLVNTSFKIDDIFNSGFLVRSLLVVFIIGLIAGLIPSLILSRFKSIDIVKGIPARLKNNFSQKVMVVFQYTVSIALIAIVAFIMKQNSYMKNYDLGFDKEHTFYIRMTNETNKQKSAFQNELMKISGVQAISFCKDFPGGPINNSSFKFNEKAHSFDQFRVDTAFFSALGIPLKNRISITDNGTNKFALILNQTAINDLGLEPPYNEFKLYNNVVKINEVVVDMNFRSLSQKPRPTMFEISEMKWAYFVLVRGSGGNLAEIVNQAKAIFKEISPADPIDLQFIDEAINVAYKKEERAAKIVGYFAIFAIIISSLGIFALATYTAQNRCKEIGVRKVNGAKINQIIYLLNRNFTQWVVFSFLLAIPIVWVFMTKWLENFAYKTELSWWIFALSGVLVLGIALLTVSVQSWKAATRNPIESLRYE